MVDMRKRRGRDHRDCRIVAFFRVDPARIEIPLPAKTQLHRVADRAIGGFAMTRRAVMGSYLVPAPLIRRERVVHFLYAERPESQGAQPGAIVLRCDTSSRLDAWIGRSWRWRRRRHHARFHIAASADQIDVRCDSDDRRMHMLLRARPMATPPAQSILRSKAQVFRLLRGDLHLLHPPGPASRGAAAGRLLSPSQLIPLQVERLEATFFRDPDRFAEGAVEFDSAYMIRDEEMVWSSDAGTCREVAAASTAVFEL
jgi:hypothetical protein